MTHPAADPDTRADFYTFLAENRLEWNDHPSPEYRDYLRVLRASSRPEPWEPPVRIPRKSLDRGSVLGQPFRQ